MSIEKIKQYSAKSAFINAADWDAARCAEEHVKKAEAQKRVSKNSLIASVVSIVLTGVVALANNLIDVAAGNSHLSIALYGIFSLLVCTSALLTFFHFINKDKANQTYLPLSPEVSPFLCELALEFIQNSGPYGIQWRDYAIARRGQLYEFDVAILYCCLKLYAEQHDAQSGHEICREIYTYQGNAEAAAPSGQRPINANA